MKRQFLGGKCFVFCCQTPHENCKPNPFLLREVKETIQIAVFPPRRGFGCCEHSAISGTPLAAGKLWAEPVLWMGDARVLGTEAGVEKAARAVSASNTCLRVSQPRGRRLLREHKKESRYLRN